MDRPTTDRSVPDGSCADRSATHGRPSGPPAASATTRGIVTFHVVRERPGRQIVVMARMLTDRIRLRRVPGLAFAKVLGTGRGGDTASSSDLRRQAYVLVWDDPAAAHRFLAGHPIARRWSHLDVEHDLELRLLGGHGSWSERRILDDLVRVPDDGGPIVVVTRARIRPRSWRAFHRASHRTAEAIDGTPGLLWAIGVGELPVGLLGTVTCWRSRSDLDRFVSTDPTHAEVAALADEWFAESLFARFAPTETRPVCPEPGGGRFPADSSGLGDGGRAVR